jgi:hypothetical protein
MSIFVLAPPAIVATLAPQPGQWLLTWAGGISPYQVQMATDLDNPTWQNFGAPIGGNSLSLTPTNDAAFYRVLGR